MHSPQTLRASDLLVSSFRAAGDWARQSLTSRSSRSLNPTSVLWLRPSQSRPLSFNMWGQPNKPIWLASSSAILAKDERIKGYSYARRQDGEDAVDMRSQVSETNVIGNEGGLWPIWGKSRASQLAPPGLTISQVESKHFNLPRALHLSYTYSATDSARTRLIIQCATNC